MGRTQGFDTAAVVRAARDVFWATGFENASVPELEAATGLNRSSIYHAFGSKRGLFDAAIDSYLNEVVRPRLRPLQAEQVAPTALDEYLAGLDAALRARGSTIADDGCLLINTASAPIAQDDAVRQAIVDYRAEMFAAIRRGLAARHPERTEAQLDSSARAVSALVISALALTRADPASALDNLGTARELAA
ncbi:TetR/AcrR family transcriptional regulator [Protaetiibacter intestinalis]|uniref:TetR/AcrR family transcriptional regulator n=1 Tax=Protaetiibacter intestinalis TaxID=2419774 RepID=A0A387B641_9MICO|nr:TetR/AcrR family transcriptional regulator [Protaetiibacter intestinalis]AYF97813.1 TetR/AcrR family transcriptional regulator [Protaetiibacter intestinalis]